MISIIDYGLGNIQAFANIYKRLNIEVNIARTKDELEKANKLILPGVGSFDWAMKRLVDSGMRNLLDEMVIGEKTSILGICVGMQMMATRSDEGELPGLGWIDGDVKRFDMSGSAERTELPHMGWNDVRPVGANGLFKALDEGARFYFLHSYYFASKDDKHVLALTDYNGQFASSVGRNNIYGVQFHPEKSHLWGIQLLKNFAELEQC
jgi:glutamine amidotransferase